MRAVFDDAGPGTGLAARQVVQEDDGAAMRAALVADLRTACTAHPHDPDLAALVADLRRSSTRFAALWDTGAVGVHTSARKVVLHPSLGPVEVDCDVLTVAGSDLRLVVYSAAAASPAARALELLRVTGPVPLASG